MPSISTEPALGEERPPSLVTGLALSILGRERPTRGARRPEKASRRPSLATRRTRRSRDGDGSRAAPWLGRSTRARATRPSLPGRSPWTRTARRFRDRPAPKFRRSPREGRRDRPRRTACPHRYCCPMCKGAFEKNPGAAGSEKTLPPSVERSTNRSSPLPHATKTRLPTAATWRCLPTNPARVTRTGTCPTEEEGGEKGHRFDQCIRRRSQPRL